MATPRIPERATISPGPAGVDLAAREIAEEKDVVDLGLGVAAVAVEQDYRLSSPDAAPEDAADGDGAQVAIVVECGDEQLERPLGVRMGRRDMADYCLEEGGKVQWRVVEVRDGVALARRGVEDGKVELVSVGSELKEEVLDGPERLGDASGRAVDLVDNDDGAQTLGHGGLEDVARLGSRAVHGVDEQEAAVGHVDDALDLAAEVNVAGGVDDVDDNVAVADGGVLGKDCDAALALLRVGIHDEVDDVLVVPEDVGVAQHGVDKGGLAVVDVGDDGDVADMGLRFDGHGC